MLKALIDQLLVRVFGHYAHPYTITYQVPAPYAAGRFKAVARKYIGSKNDAIEMCRSQMRNGRAVSARIHTRGGVLIWEGTC